MEKDLISIILPFYNEEKYIKQSLQSVLDSDYPNLEIICIDDGSTDSGPDLVRSFEDERIQLISQPNLGISQARNAGLARAKGDFIFFLDADDQIRSDYLSKLHEAIQQNNAQVVISNYQVQNEQGIRQLPGLSQGNYPSLESVFFTLYESAHFNPPWNKLYRREIIHELFDPNLSLGEDLVFNLAVLAPCTSIYVLDDDGYTYTKRKDGLHNQPQSTRELFYLYDQIQKYVPNDSRRYRWHIQKHFIRHCYEQDLKPKEEIAELKRFFKSQQFPFSGMNTTVLFFWDKLYRIKRGFSS